MANKVTFDYSKTAEYISEGEITAMKRIAEEAKKLLLSREGEGNDSLDGSIFRWITIRKNLLVFRKRRQRYRAIQMSCLLSVLVVHILEPEQLMNSWDTIFIISFQSQ